MDKGGQVWRLLLLEIVIPQTRLSEVNLVVKFEAIQLQFDGLSREMKCLHLQSVVNNNLA